MLLTAGPALGAILGGAIGAASGLLAGAGAAAGASHLLGRRGRRRVAALSLPFPQSARDLLLERYGHFERLPTEWRGRFEDDVRLFLAETRITGIGTDATEERRLLVAASAVTLTLGWPDAEWDQVTEVLLYPDDFDRDYSFGTDDDEGRAGEAHPWGTIILSVPTLEESFDYDDDGYHVGLHEFAHLLDVEQAHFDGMPRGLAAAARQEWPGLVAREMERIRKRHSVLDDYGAEDEVEFFPVAVEAFFERPQTLRRRHHELYETLRDYFAQDPAAWEDALGRRA